MLQLATKTDTTDYYHTTSNSDLMCNTIVGKHKLVTCKLCDCNYVYIYYHLIITITSQTHYYLRVRLQHVVIHQNKHMYIDSNMR